ncbi:MAG: winged helix-turn-helix transcriptional regulator [Myxococcota bacterium]
MTTGAGDIAPMDTHRTRAATWTFLSNHAHVLLCLARTPNMRLREVSEKVGITERAVQRIVADLQDEGYIEIHKEGRRNRYVIHLDRSLRHGVESRCRVEDLISLLVS